MVGVVPRGKHSRGASPEHLVSLQGVGLGRAERFLRPSSLPDPFPDNRDLQSLNGLGETLAAMLPGPRGRQCGHGGRYLSCACTRPSGCRWPRAPGA